MQALPTFARMDDKIEIGKRIRAARAAKSLTQGAVAGHLGIHRVNITQWEQGLTAPDRSRLPALSDILGVTVEWILTGEGNAPSTAPGVESSFDALVTNYPEHLKPEAEAFLRFLVESKGTKVPPASGKKKGPPKAGES